MIFNYVSQETIYELMSYRALYVFELTVIRYLEFRQKSTITILHHKEPQT